MQKAIIKCYTSDGVAYPVVVSYTTREERQWFDWKLVITTVIEVANVFKLERNYSDFKYDLMVGFENLLNTKVKIEL